MVEPEKHSPDRFRADVMANWNNQVILERWEFLALSDGWRLISSTGRGFVSNEKISGQ